MESRVPPITADYQRHNLSMKWAGVRLINEERKQKGWIRRAFRSREREKKKFKHFSRPTKKSLLYDKSIIWINKKPGSTRNPSWENKGEKVSPLHKGQISTYRWAGKCNIHLYFYPASRHNATLVTRWGSAGFPPVLKLYLSHFFRLVEHNVWKL